MRTMSNPTTPEYPIVCALCFASINDQFLVDHMRWHEYQGENAHTVEKQLEAAVARIWLLERNQMGHPPTGDPQGHHHQMY